MAAQTTTYSIYVRFRDRRLALLKHIRSLDTARAALRALRADRFHDADQVFMVNDRTKETVEDVAPAGRETAPPTGDEHGRREAGERAASRGVDADGETAADAAAEPAADRAADHAPDRGSAASETAPAAPASRDADARPPVTREPLTAGPVSPGSSASAPDQTRSDAPAPSDPEAPLEPPLVRLRRAMATTRVARARHATALSAVVGLRPSGILDQEEVRRLEASAIESSRLSAHALAQLEDIVALFDRSGS